MSRIDHINLHESRLYCFERNPEGYRIKNIIRAIKNGDIFPPVPVLFRGNNEYELINECVTPVEGTKDFTLEGGHHRAYAHFKTNHPLKVEIYTLEELTKLKNHIFDGFYRSNIPLEELMPIFDKVGYRGIIKAEVNYRKNHHRNIFKKAR